MKRHENIEGLQRDFIIVNDLFKDTAMLAKEQGVMLGEAEKSVSVAVQETGKGVKELHKADKYQQKAKSKLTCILIVAVLIVLGLVGLFLGLFAR